MYACTPLIRTVSFVIRCTPTGLHASLLGTVPRAELHPVLQHLLFGHVGEDGLEHFQGRLGAVLHVQPGQQQHNVAVKVLEPGGQEPGLHSLPDGLWDTETQSPGFTSCCDGSYSAVNSQPFFFLDVK